MESEASQSFFTNDAIVFGILAIVLAGVFYTSSLTNKYWKGFYRFVPPLFLCYFIPALLNYPLNLISGDVSKIYNITANYLLPACLVLLCLSVDFKSILKLGPKALIMFLTGTVGVIIGGPVALLMVTRFFPGLISAPADELWRGFSTVAGSWIGGGANQTAMKEIYQVNDNLFGTMVVVDIVVANLWMGFLLCSATIRTAFDRWLKADMSAIDELITKVSSFQTEVNKIPSTTELFYLIAIAFGSVALGHWCADLIVPALDQHAEVLKVWKLHAIISKFFWVVLITTTLGLWLSFTKARQLEGVGASKWGTVFIYLLVASIGMKMNLKEVSQNLGLFVVGFIWILVHAGLLLLVARLIRAPLFFLAVGSQANIGGAASAPVVASAFNPALAPVGVLLAVLGYALGTYGAIICAQLMFALVK